MIFGWITKLSECYFVPFEKGPNRIAFKLAKKLSTELALPNEIVILQEHKLFYQNLQSIQIMTSGWILIPSERYFPSFKKGPDQLEVNLNLKGQTSFSKIP